MKQKHNFFKNNKSYIIIAIIILLIIAGIFITNIITKNYIYPLKYIEIVETEASNNNLDKYLIMAVIKAESNFNETAVSRQNAKGLMQLLDSTAQYVDNSADESINLFDSSTNIRIGSKYLRMLLDSFDNNLDMALIAYNAGEGNTRKWVKEGKIDPNNEDTFDNIPYNETKNYLKKIKKNYNVYIQIYNK